MLPAHRYPPQANKAPNSNDWAKKWGIHIQQLFSRLVACVHLGTGIRLDSDTWPGGMSPPPP